MADRQRIYVIDDDAAVRHNLFVLLTAARFYVKTFASPSEFLADKAHKEGCLIIDVRMPNINWLEFRIELAKQKHDLVMLVITGHGDIPIVVGAMQAGAMDFIEKPFDRKQIVASVRRALDIRASSHDQSAETEAAKRKLALLTEREMAVARELAEGKSNKEAAARLGISPRTIELHRANILRKLKIAGISPLVRLMIAAGVHLNGNSHGGAPREQGLTLIAGGKSSD